MSIRDMLENGDEVLRCTHSPGIIHSAISRNIPSFLPRSLVLPSFPFYPIFPSLPSFLPPCAMPFPLHTYIIPPPNRITPHASSSYSTWNYTPHNTITPRKIPYTAQHQESFLLGNPPVQAPAFTVSNFLTVFYTCKTRRPCCGPAANYSVSSLSLRSLQNLAAPLCCRQGGNFASNCP